MSKRSMVKALRRGKRLVTKPPKRETPKTVYTRKAKHKGRV